MKKATRIVSAATPKKTKTPAKSVAVQGVHPARSATRHSMCRRLMGREFVAGGSDPGAATGGMPCSSPRQMQP